jgi:hypothetical protein
MASTVTLPVPPPGAGMSSGRWSQPFHFIADYAGTPGRITITERDWIMPVDFLQPVLADAIVYFQKKNLKSHKKRVDLPAPPGPKGGLRLWNSYPWRVFNCSSTTWFKWSFNKKMAMGAVSLLRPRIFSALGYLRHSSTTLQKIHISGMYTTYYVYNFRLQYPHRFPCPEDDR